MRDTVYFLVFDGFADWQAALALCEVRRPGDWRVRTVGFTLAPVVSMGGLAVQPELALAELDLQRAAMLIVPGGHLWQRGEGESAVAALRRLHAAGAPVAGIDSGVLALARAGLLDACRHTGNWPGHIASRVPDYSGADQYDANVLAVSDGGTITASLSARPGGSGGSAAANNVAIWLRRWPRIARRQPSSPGKSSSAE